jgi:trypsin-like peptidase
MHFDAYTRAAQPVRMFFNETELSHATCFFWKKGDQLLLITNWHVITGKNPNTLQPLDQVRAGLPNALVLRLLSWEGKAIQSRVALDSDEPTWWVHPKYGRKVDVIALPIETPGPELVPFKTINTLHETALATRIGMPVFVLGYPFPPKGPAIWKQGTIASEPDLARRGDPMLIDTLSRKGMSGSPVIQRAIGHAIVEAGLVNKEDPDSPMETQLVVLHQMPASKFVGVYSGRLHTKDSFDAQLGMVWRRHLVEEIVAAGRLDAPV